MEEQEIKIYKLKYPSQEEGITDLLTRGILLTEDTFEYPVHAVVSLGDGLFDVMTELTGNFDMIQIFPRSPDHTFAGWNE